MSDNAAAPATPPPPPAGTTRLINMTLGPAEQVTVYGAKLVEVHVPKTATGPAVLRYTSMQTRESNW